MNTKNLISKKDLNLIINVDNFSVEAAVFDSGKNNFLQAMEVLEKENLVKGGVNYISGIEKKLERALRKIVEKAASSKKGIGFCLVVFSSPWFISQTHFVKIRKEEPFVFGKEGLDKILKDENSAFVRSLKDGSDLKFIEAEIMKVLLNGYEIQNPFGKKAKSVELRIYLAAVKNSFFEFIKNLVGLNLGLSGDSLFIKTRPSLFFLGLKDFLDFKEGAVFVDIGGDVTEIILIKDNYIEEVASFNKGYNFFVRRLMSAFNFSFDEADSAFSMHQKNFLENGFKRNIEGILKESQKEWQDSFQRILKELSRDHFLPKNLFFFSARPASKEFFIPSSFSAREISFKEISSRFNASEADLKKYNPFLLIEAAFLKK